MNIVDSLEEMETTVISSVSTVTSLLEPFTTETSITITEELQKYLHAQITDYLPQLLPYSGINKIRVSGECAWPSGNPVWAQS